MNEDLDFNRFLKAALESNETFEACPDRSRRRSVIGWVIPSLMAASLTLAAILHAFLSTGVNRVGDAIELLSLADGVTVEGESPADLLLAWQDAPCVADM